MTVKNVTVTEDITGSAELQELIDKTGNVEAVYNFETKKIEISSLLRYFNSTRWNMNGCTFTLEKHAPSKIFDVQVPLIAPKYPTAAENLYFQDGIFYGNDAYQDFDKGLGYHNFFLLGSLNNVKYSNATNCHFSNLKFYNSLGDGIRVEGGNKIYADGVYGSEYGHDLVCFAGVDTFEISNVTADISVNAGVRFRSVKHGSIHGCKINGKTKRPYCPGIQGQSTAENWSCNDVMIYDNYIHDTYGPGIWILGSVPGNDVTIRNNTLERCGQMPKANEIPGVGGIVIDGFDATVDHNTFVDSYGYALMAGYYKAKSSVKSLVTVSENIFTGTQKSLYPASSDAAIANLTSGRCKITATKNCFYGNVQNAYGVTLTDSIFEDPLFVGYGDYHLRDESPCPTWGRYGDTREEDPIQDDKAKLLISCKGCDVDKIVKSIPYSYKIYRGY